MAAKFIPVENLHEYHPWNPARIEQNQSVVEKLLLEEEVIEETPPAPELPSADDIGRIYHDAHKEGYDAGLVEGLEAGHSEGYEAGHAEGRETGYAKGHEEAVAKAEPLAPLFTSFTSAVEEFRQDISVDVVALALDIAKQMLREALAAKPKLLIPVVKSAMEGLPQGAELPQIHLHPLDAALVQDLLKAELAQASWKIVEDQRIERGGCRIESTTAEIDATMPSRWQRIAAALGQNHTWLENDK
ncbi:MAG: flagellar assembly protein FliH [Methylophilaceae bacterium]